MKLASFDTAEEYESVRQMMITNSDKFSDWTHIDGITTEGRSTDQWYWSQTGEKIKFNMTWRAAQPDFSHNRQWCLSLGPKSAKQFYFDDIDCFHHHEEKFLCEKN